MIQYTSVKASSPLFYHHKRLWCLGFSSTRWTQENKKYEHQWAISLITGFHPVNKSKLIGCNFKWLVRTIVSLFLHVGRTYRFSGGQGCSEDSRRIKSRCVLNGGVGNYKYGIYKTMRKVVILILGSSTYLQVLVKVYKSSHCLPLYKRANA